MKIDKRNFNDFYFPYLTDYSHRYEVHKGSAGSGKSYIVMQKCIIKALSSKRKILVMRKVGATIKDSTWQLAIDILQQFQIYDKCTINKSDFTITLPNESVFLFKALDNPEKIKSITGVTDIVCEECTEFTLDDITQLNLRLRAKVPNCQMIFMFNPVSKENYVYKYFKFHEAEENETMPVREYGDTIVFCTTYKNNKFLSDDYIKALEGMAENNPYYYKVYVLGIFASRDKLVFPNHVIEEFDYKEILQQKNTTAIFGLDFGYINDSTAFCCTVFDEDNKKLYIFDEHYQKGMLNNEIAGMIISKGFSKEVIIADCAERKSIDEIKRLGVSRMKPARKGKGSIMQGIQKINQYQIVIHPSCTNAIMEVRNYSYKKDKNSDGYLNEIEDKYNHLMDALRYSIQSIKKRANILTIKL